MMLMDKKKYDYYWISAVSTPFIYFEIRKTSLPELFLIQINVTIYICTTGKVLQMTRRQNNKWRCKISVQLKEEDENYFIHYWKKELS